MAKQTVTCACGQEAAVWRVTKEFSAASPTGWQVTTETPLCQTHFAQEQEAAA